MKVLHLSSERTWRGGENQIALLMSGLAAQGAVSSVLVRSGSAMHDYCQRQGLLHRTAGYGGAWDVMTALALRSWVQQEGFQLVHAHSSKSHTTAVLAAALGCQVPIVVSRRVDFVPRPGAWRRWRYSHPRLRAIICVSRAIEAIVKPVAAPHVRVVTIHSGINTHEHPRWGENQFWPSAGMTPGQPVVGTLAALAPHKDLKTWLRVAQLVHTQLPQVQWVIYGEGSERAELEKLRAELGLQQVVQMPGFVNGAQGALPWFSVFLLTSVTEGLGTSVLDAFNAGVPVVATAAGGIPEMVEHRQTGWLAPVADVQALAQGVITILSQPDLAQNLVQRASEKVKGFDYRNTALKTLELYREILTQTP